MFYTPVRMTGVKKPTIIAFRPTDGDMEVLRWLQERLGVGYSAILRLGLRRLFQTEQNQK